MKDIGLVLTGQSADLAPADGKLYALRDVTGTVQSIPLIASSVMSKKIAAGAQAILLDVKVGIGAFMQTEAEGQILATRMVDIAKLAGPKSSHPTFRYEPTIREGGGECAKPTEAIDTLQGERPADFREHCLNIASHILILGSVASAKEDGLQKSETAIRDGRAWARFRDLVVAQGGDVSFVDHPEKLPRAQFVETVLSPHTGYLRQINARMIGETAVELGGRAKKGDLIDHAVGIIVHHKVGNRTTTGQPLFTIHANDNNRLKEAREKVLSAHKWSDGPVESLPLFYGVVK